MKKTALFGGSFNPIHLSHIRIAKSLINKKIVDEVWLIPCKKHAFDKKLASTKDRLEMINLMIGGMKNIKISRIELEARGKNYTIKTLRKLNKKYPKKDFFLVVGSDILHEIKKWHRYKELLKKAKFIVFKRKGYKLIKILGMNIVFLLKECRECISSTEIRKRAKEGKSLKKLVPLLIERYIKKRGIYK